MTEFHILLFLASNNFCRLLITFANSLGPDKDQQNVSPDLDLILLTFLKEFLKKSILTNFKNSQQTTAKSNHVNSSRGTNLTGLETVKTVLCELISLQKDCFKNLVLHFFHFDACIRGLPISHIPLSNQHVSLVYQVMLHTKHQGSIPIVVLDKNVFKSFHSKNLF